MPDPVLTPAQREALRVLYGGAEMHHRYLPCGRRGAAALVGLGLAATDHSGWFRITPAGRARHEKEEAS